MDENAIQLNNQKNPGNFLEGLDPDALLVFERRNRALRLVYGSVVEFEEHTGKNVYGTIVKYLQQLTNAEYIALSEYLKKEQVFALRAVYYDYQHITDFGGNTIKTSHFEPNGDFINDLKSRIISRCEGHLNCLVAFLGEKLPYFESVASSPNCYRFSCVRGNDVLAMGMLVLPERESLKMIDIIEMYLNLCGIVLQRKEAIDEHLESEYRFQLMSNLVGNWVWELDLSGKIIYSSDAVAGILGYPRDEIVNKKYFYDFFMPEERDHLKDLCFRHMNNGEPIKGLQYRVQTKYGRVAIFEKIAVPVRNEDSQVIGYIGSDLDITDKLRVETELKESEEKYKQLVERANDGILIIVDTLIAYANPMFYQMIEYEPREVIGRPFWEFLHPDEVDKLKERYNRRMSGEQVERIYESKILSKSGNTLYVELNAGIISYDGVSADLVFIRDITERKQAQEALRKSYAKLEKILNETVDALSSAVEMRDPYTAGHQRRVSELACMIAKELGLDEEEVSGILVAGLVHDIGKIYVPAEILSKPGKLNELEFSLIKLHPKVGYDILNRIEFYWPIADIVLQHHERLNGSGYPNGLSGDNIMFGARIIAVADVVEAMVAHRPYRPGLGVEKALMELNQNKGVLYDANVVDVCIDLFAKKGFCFKYS